ncbi:MAG: prenyltransferase/squalene oxidase repeat-containing protein, partial [Kiritimatiellae bacterium]|nr:prenyltransferase/squalene oxidase repeat-containing protein [Kiritimatiellia bacterium]
MSFYAGMTNLVQTLESTAARGAEGLTPEARECVAAALLALQGPDGGFAGLDGKSDPYYSLFAWLGLRALGAACDRNRLCDYLAAHRRDANTVDAQCAAFVLACEGHHPHLPWLKFGTALLRGDTRGVYAAFMLALALGNVPRWLARLTWRRQKRMFEAGVVERLPTPRLAAGLILASLAGECGTGEALAKPSAPGGRGLPRWRATSGRASRDRGFARASCILSALTSRHCASGGFVSAPRALPDLLATAVARFSIGNQQSSIGGE